MTLRKKFIALLSDEHSQNIIMDSADSIIDYIANDEIISSLPVVGTLANIGKASISFRDRLLIKKISMFLKHIQTIPKSELDDFLSEIEDEEYREKIGEKILILLDSADCDDKAKIIGALFKKLISKELSSDEFDMFSHTVDKINFFELHLLRHSHVNEYSMQEIGPLFLPFRIVSFQVELCKHEPNALFGDQTQTDYVKQVFSLTKYGKKFVQCLNEVYD